MARQDLPHWQGRDDTADEGQRAMRWHQQVQPWNPPSPPGIALVGFACDEGVKRNQGRTGSAEAPDALRAMLGNLAWQQTTPLYDAGSITCPTGDLEQSQTHLGLQVASVLKHHSCPLVLGGGHETAWGTFSGIVTHQPGSRLGIINLDAHFDLRAGTRPHSGTPFAQMGDWHYQQGKLFNYLVLGVSEAANTGALFDQARYYSAKWMTDVDLATQATEQTVLILNSFLQQHDLVYLSIDLDVLPASSMPAVSAPAALGVPAEKLLPVIAHIAGTGKLCAADVVEYNPALDRDSVGARLAARVIWELVTHWKLP